MVKCKLIGYSGIREVHSRDYTILYNVLYYELYILQ
jgi:hypothetical protein